MNSYVKGMSLDYEDTRKKKFKVWLTYYVLEGLC